MSSTVIILGMHRSGTSCLAGSLEAQGLFLGNVNNGAPHNKKGNKENNITWSINDSVLSYSNGSWDSPPTELVWNDHACKLCDEFIAIYTDSTVWGFKDPRCVLTLPFWLEGLKRAQKDVRIIGTFRHPLSVARSLEKRNEFTVSQSLDLWNTYNLLILKYQQQFGFPLISYDWDQDRYNQAVTSFAGSLNLATEKARAAATPFYDKALKHYALQSFDEGLLSPGQLETYSLLLNGGNRSFEYKVKNQSI